MERVYSDLAVKLRRKSISLSDVVDRLRKMDPTPEAFKASFMSLATRTNYLARYILLEISDKLIRDSGEAEKTTNRGSVHLEHIIPKTPNREWKEFLVREHVDSREVVNLLGNMTILLDEYNRSISNHFFDVKKQMYQKSSLPINQDLKTLEKFGWDEIEIRQRRYSDLAGEIWHL